MDHEHKKDGVSEAANRKRGREPSLELEGEEDKCTASKSAMTGVEEPEHPSISVAVVGCRDFHNYGLLKAELDRILSDQKVTEIVSGGARGADTLAKRYARERNIPLYVFSPKWHLYGKGAGLERNTDIVRRSNLVVAFWDGKSKGTGDTVRKARSAGKTFEIVRIDVTNSPRSSAS